MPRSAGRGRRGTARTRLAGGRKILRLLRPCERVSELQVGWREVFLQRWRREGVSSEVDDRLCVLCGFLPPRHSCSPSRRSTASVGRLPRQREAAKQKLTHTIVFYHTAVAYRPQCPTAHASKSALLNFDRNKLTLFFSNFHRQPGEASLALVFLVALSYVFSLWLAEGAVRRERGGRKPREGVQTPHERSGGRASREIRRLLARQGECRNFHLSLSFSL